MNKLKHKITAHISIMIIFSTYNQTTRGCRFIETTYLKSKVSQAQSNNLVFGHVDNLSAIQATPDVPICINPTMGNKKFHQIIQTLTTTNTERQYN